MALRLTIDCWPHHTIQTSTRVMRPKYAGVSDRQECSLPLSISIHVCVCMCVCYTMYLSLAFCSESDSSCRFSCRKVSFSCEISRCSNNAYNAYNVLENVQRQQSLTIEWPSLATSTFIYMVSFLTISPVTWGKHRGNISRSNWCYYSKPTLLQLNSLDE